MSSQSGAICLDILKGQWSPALTLKTALLSIQALLSSPQPDDPQDAVVAKQYVSNYEEFEQTAKEWTQQYAQKSEDDRIKEEEQHPKVLHLTEMGFDKSVARNALVKANWDEEGAINILLAPDDSP